MVQQHPRFRMQNVIILLMHTNESPMIAIREAFPRFQVQYQLKEKINLNSKCKHAQRVRDHIS